MLLRSHHDQSVRWTPGERLASLFEEVCDRLRAGEAADRLAVDAGTVRLSYEELDARANQLARHLLADGIRPGDRIALLFDQAVWSYISILAVLKIHAAFVPLDAGFPADRIGYIVDDAEASRVLTLSHLAHLLPGNGVRALKLDLAAGEIEHASTDRLGEDEQGEPVSDLAYVIYTSGSTGRPKGVAIEHHSICNFVRVASEVYGYQADDRVYQGLTIAFDFSVEEIWVPWMVGATLVPKPSPTSLLGADLAEFLMEQRITAMCCVPTLLATIEDDLPDLRFLLVSGEACPPDLAERWHRSDRRFLNVYGPTEATVTATMDVVRPGNPITLGQPLPTYTVMILDPEEPRALQHGETGEIGIAGIGVAAGYINRPDKTDEVFIDDFLGIDNNTSGRIYRSGDLGRITEDGLIEYFGRIDTQVKIRGYRIELSEIESVLLQVPGIAQAVVDTYESAPGMKELAAYYTLRSSVSELDPRDVCEQLRERLPAYMVPTFYEQLATMPMLPSDKADRKSLPIPRNRVSTGSEVEYVAPETEVEAALAENLGRILSLERVSVEADIFDDLGANSLLIAHFSAALRSQTELPPVGIKVIYENPTIRGLAAVLHTEPAPSAWAEDDVRRLPGRASALEHVICGFLQTVIAGSYFFLMMFAVVAGYEWTIRGAGLLEIWGRSLVVGVAFFIVLSIAPICLKWLIIGRWREQEIRIWSLSYVRFWFVKTLIRMNPLVFFVGTPILPLYLRLLGAKIGSDVLILSPTIPVCADLLTIGSGTVICKDSHILGYRARDGWIETGPVTLGVDVVVSEKSVLDIGSTMGDGAQLGHGSSLQKGQTVPAGESWHGSPAVRAEVEYRQVESVRPSRLRRFLYGAAVLIGSSVSLAPTGLLLIAVVVPWYVGTGHMNFADPWFYLDLLLVAFALLTAALLFALITVATVPRVLNRLLVPGKVYPVYGLHYAVHRLILTMTNYFPLMHITADSSLVVHYLRLLGYKQPNLVQTGSNFGPEVTHENPYLTTIGSGTMVSDGLSVMNSHYSNNSFRLNPVVVGSSNFFGNDVAYPAGARTGENVLYGSKTMVPIDGPVRNDIGLLGSPAFEIPRSVDRDAAWQLSGPQLAAGLQSKNIHNAVSIELYLISRWILVFAALLSFALALTLLPDVTGFGLFVGWLVFSTFSISFGIALEWATQGFRRMRPTVCSIYDERFWRHERFWRFIEYPPPFLDGTPFKPLVWRLHGVRMGKRVFDDGCVIPEKTLVTIGDDATLNFSSIVQCHSMEDGAFKLDTIRIGNGVTLGIYIYLHYDVEMGDGSILESDSFLMKGARVPAGARYGGNPAEEIST